MPIVFIGGFQNTGTRILVRILEKLKYRIPKPYNPTLDYMGIDIYQVAHGIFQEKRPKKWIAHFNALPSNEPTVYKHGHFCLGFKDLKKSFPKSIRILCWRDPFDSLVKPSHNYVKFEGLTRNPPLEQKFSHYSKWYTPEIIENSDIVIKMEDLLFNKEKTLKAFLTKLGIPYTTELIEELASIILPPSKTVGVGEDLLRSNPLYPTIVAFREQLEKATLK